MPRKADVSMKKVPRAELKDGRVFDDCDFQGMIVDEEYQSEALRIAAQFAASDAGALDITEQDMSKS